MPNEEPLFESKFPGDLLFYAILLAVLGCVILLGLGPIFTKPGNLIFNLWLMLLSLICLSIAAAILIRIETYKTYVQRIDKYRISGRLKETILLKDISGWGERKGFTKSGPILFLYVFTTEKRYLIGRDSDYEDYDSFKSYIIQNKPKRDV